MVDAQKLGGIASRGKQLLGCENGVTETIVAGVPPKVTVVSGAKSAPAMVTGVSTAGWPFGGVTLAIEAWSLGWMVLPPQKLDFATAARIKAASYLAYAVHYGLGAGVLSFLVRRRAGLGLSEAAGRLDLSP